jgi:hypothetical protein
MEPTIFGEMSSADADQQPERVAEAYEATMAKLRDNWQKLGYSDKTVKRHEKTVFAGVKVRHTPS